MRLNLLNYLHDNIHTVGFPRQSGFYGNSLALLVLDNVVCSGTESSILDCQHDGLGNASCYHRDDAGVQCLGSANFAILFSSILISLFSSLYKVRV